MPYTPYSRFNALLQDLDVAGSTYQSDARWLTDETGGMGAPVILNSGANATITAFTTPQLTGTFAVTNDSTAVTASTAQSGLLFAGDVITFASQPGVQYTVVSVTGTAIVLGQEYEGVTNAATMASPVPLSPLTSGAPTYAPTTFSVSASVNVVASTSMTGILVPGSLVVFASQPGVEYKIATVAGTALTLSVAYSGTVNTATPASVISSIVTLTGTFSVAVTSANVTATVSQTNVLFPGDGIVFTSDTTYTEYTILTVSGTAIVLTAPYTGATETSSPAVAIYDPLVGSFAVTHESNMVTASQSQTGFLFPGNTIVFASRPLITYTVAAVSGTAITLTTDYTGPTNAAISAVVAPPSYALTVGGLTGQSASSVGTLLLLAKSGEAGNSGVFPITMNTSASVDVVSDPNGYFPDSNSGNIAWTQFNSGNAPVVGTVVVSGVAPITGLANMTQNSVGHFLQLSGFTNPLNNGTFLIVVYTSATAVSIANANAASTDTGSLWVERCAYSLNDDLDFERTDRSAIKGVPYDQPVPTYIRPDLNEVPIPKNLSNIYSLDAKVLNVNQIFYQQSLTSTTALSGTFSVTNGLATVTASTSQTVLSPGSAITFADLSGVIYYVQSITAGTAIVLTSVYLGTTNAAIAAVLDTAYVVSTSAGALPHANIANLCAIPCFDTAPYVGDFLSCFVGVVNYTTDDGMYVLGGTALPGTFAVTNGSPDVTASISQTGYLVAGNKIQFTSDTLDVQYTILSVSVSGTAIVLTANYTGTTFGSTKATNTTNEGNKIFGVSTNGNSTSPNSIQVNFYSVPIGGNVSTQSVPYLWETAQPTTINLIYGKGERGDLLDVNCLRTTPALGLVSDAFLQQEINNILNQLGTTFPDTNISGQLTNTGGDYPFSYLSGGAGDTVISALNVLNQQIGNDTYSGSILGSYSGQTITYLLQTLANAIAATTVTRTIERLSSAVPANTAHTLPGGLTYNLDGTNNGKYFWVVWRGIWRDPGTVANGDDYQETDPMHITPYSKIPAGDHITYVTI